MSISAVFYAGLAKFDTQNISFVNGASAFISFGATLIAMTFALITSTKNKNKDSKLFQCILLINIMLYIDNEYNRSC